MKINTIETINGIAVARIREMTIDEMSTMDLTAEDFEPKSKQPEIVTISRENFNLLNATQNNVIYYIVELDNTITIIKGENK